VGDVFDRVAVDRDVRNLYATGWFTRLKVAESTTNDGVILNYLLQERPKLTKIRFEGNTRHDEAYLSKALLSKLGGGLDERTLIADVQSLQEFYRRLGFSGAEVKSVCNVNEDVGEAEAVFKITE
jgi:outer membrane protein insertion porin family